MTWREQSLKIIRQIVADNPNATNAELRKIVSKAYPFGPRAMHPYKAWLKAVAQVLGPSDRKRRRCNTCQGTGEIHELDLFQCSSTTCLAPTAKRTASDEL
jgi:hypothetical protein